MDSAESPGTEIYRTSNNTNVLNRICGDISFHSESMQFQSSEQLFDPTKAHITVEKAVEIFKTPPGAQRFNWRSQILEAVGYSRFIPSSKVLTSVISLKTKVDKAKRRKPEGEWKNILVEVGDPQKWEEQFSPEFGPKIKQNQYVDILIDSLKENRERERKKTEENAILLQKLNQKNEEMNELQYNYVQQLKKKDEKINNSSAEIEKRDKDIENLQNDSLNKTNEIEALEAKNEKNDQKIKQLRKLNKDKANKLNYKGVSSATGPAKRKSSDESSSSSSSSVPNKIFKVTENGRVYCMAFVMLCVQLSWLGVKDLKIPPVIMLITTFFGICLDNIPDQSTVTRWCNEQIVFIDMQINDFFENAENLTLHSDETTLSADKLQCYIICKIIDGVRKYIIVGIEQVPDKSAARSLTAFLACMKRSIDVFRNLDEDVIQEILTERLGKIVNLVGDRASTQKKFNTDVRDFTGTDVNSIFCQHHILASMWDVFIDACLRDEKIRFNSPNQKISTIKAAIETLSTDFGERSASHQKAKAWKTYCEQHKIEYYKFPSKLGSRWNIGPAICSVLYYHQKNLMDFLKSSNYYNDKSVAALVKVLEHSAYMNMVKVGAAVDQVINGSWWKELESDKHIFEINDINAEIVAYFEKVAENPSLFDTEIPLLTTTSDKQTVYRNAALSNPTPAFLNLIPEFYSSFASYLKKQFEPLTSNPKMNDELYRNEFASAAATNKVCEQTFAVATHLRHESASKSNVRIGYTVAALKNGVSEWYNGKSVKEKKAINAAAKAARKDIRRRLRQDKKALKEELIEHQKKTQLKLQKKKPLPKTGETLDIYIGKTFKQKMEDEEGEYFCDGYIQRKSNEGYVICYPAEDEDEEDIESLITNDEIDDLIVTQKIIFHD